MHSDLKYNLTYCIQSKMDPISLGGRCYSDKHVIFCSGYLIEEVDLSVTPWSQTLKVKERRKKPKIIAEWIQLREMLRGRGTLQAKMSHDPSYFGAIIVNDAVSVQCPGGLISEYLFYNMLS